MRFNRSSSTEWLAVPPELVELVEQANRISAQTDGMYDITVGPLVNLWGLWQRRHRSAAPPEQEVTAPLKQTGYQHLQVRRSPPALSQKTSPGLQVDRPLDRRVGPSIGWRGSDRSRHP